MIQAIDGTTVTTPQEAMRALTSLSRKPAAEVSARVLRDRKEESLDIIVPERMSQARFIPGHPVAPASEKGTPQVTTRRHVILVDADGNIRTIENTEDATAPRPKAPPITPL